MQYPQKEEYGAYYHQYISKIEANVIEALETVSHQVVLSIKDLSHEEFHSAYAYDKWTIAELLLHLIDVERVIAYRAMRIARGDKTPLLEFDHDAYVEQADVSQRSVQSSLDEYLAQRQATLLFFKSISEEESQRTGTASGQPLSVRAAAYIIAGHDRHHLNVIKERYLVD
jgi:uncharacterized damage-inducible protein DinB